MIELDFNKVNEAAMVLRAVKNPMRQKILRVVGEQPGIIVGDIFSKLQLEPAVTSLHLAILRQAGIVRTEREGHLIHYSIDYDNIQKISPLVEQLSEFFKGKDKNASISERSVNPSQNHSFNPKQKSFLLKKDSFFV